MEPELVQIPVRR
jgi:hypothetical protein